MQRILSKYQTLPKYQRFTLNALFIYTAVGVIAHSYITGPKRNYGLIVGKVVIITGCSAGIGKETARALAKKGAIIIFACRNKNKTLQIIDQIQRETKNNNLFFLELDLEHQESIHKFVQQFKSKFSDTKIDILINNAGIADWELNLVNGIERIFNVNQLGWFLLTLLLLPLINNQGRIINVASEMHRVITKKVDLRKAIKGQLDNRYAISKYAMIATTKKFQERLDRKKIDIKIVSLCPGGVRTEINDKSYENNFFLRILIKGLFYLMSPFTLSEKEGASTSLYCALQPYDELEGGTFYHLARKGKYSKYIEQLNQGDEIFKECLTLVQMQDI